MFYECLLKIRLTMISMFGFKRVLVNGRHFLAAPKVDLSQNGYWEVLKLLGEIFEVWEHSKNITYRQVVINIKRQVHSHIKLWFFNWHSKLNEMTKYFIRWAPTCLSLCFCTKVSVFSHYFCWSSNGKHLYEFLIFLLHSGTSQMIYLSAKLYWYCISLQGKH